MPITARRPSHRTTENGDRITVHDVELFVGNIDGFDDPKDDISEVDGKEIDRIFKKTNTLIAAGSSPKLVLLHEADGKVTPSRSYGDIVSIKQKKFTIDCEDGHFEGDGIIGDIEMTRADFDKTLATNQYPRRSAEIWPDGHMSEVALLGRSTPARPLPDTKFTRQGAKRVFDRPTTFDMVAPGGGNTFVPGSDDKDTNMDTPTEVEKLTAACETLTTENEDLKLQLAKYMEGDDDDEGTDDYMEGDDDDDDDEGAQAFARIGKTKDGAVVVKRFAKQQKQILGLTTQLSTLADDNRKEKFNRQLDQMLSQGYSGIKSNRPRMLKDLMSSDDPKETIKFWKESLHRVPVGKRGIDPDNTATGGETSNYSAEEKTRASARAVEEISTSDTLKSSDFKTVYEKQLKSGGA